MEVLVKASLWIRQFHRWISIIFTLTVIANFFAMAQSRGAMPPAWITYSPLLPLALLLFTGLYLFALPYFSKARNERKVTVAS
ncbi:hypothetical protein E2H98_08475 [Permianibacter aggregans]|nr:hypothetical protein E2H98_08475 [Permianibacter aggregans]